MYGYYGQQQPVHGLVRVTGIEGARAYQLPPNSDIPLFDANEDVMYVKTTDGAGFPTIRCFRFEPIDAMPPADTARFVTREEFDALKEAIENGKQPVQQQ